MIDLSSAPPETRERLAEWLALAETQGVSVAQERLAEQSTRLTLSFSEAATLVERLLRE